MTSNTEVRIWIAMMNHMWEWWWWILDRVAATALANVRSFALFSSSFSLDFFLLFSNNFVLKTKRKRWRWDLCLWYKIWCNNGIRAVVESGRFEKEQIMVSKKIIESYSRMNHTPALNKLHIYEISKVNLMLSHETRF